MYFSADPPSQRFTDDFPVLDKYVTVANCWYYISLMERFVDTTVELGEDLLKIYLVRAEYRYFKWLSTRENGKSVDYYIPPIDVAFYWHAHMLSPVRFAEDTKLAPSKSMITERIPLEEIHNMRTKPNPVTQRDWADTMGDEPYDLTKEILVQEPQTCALVTCIVCFSQIKIQWDKYADWRTDHSVALQCHCCFSMFTTKHVGKANLFADLSEKHHKTSGLHFDSKGAATSALPQQKLLMPMKETKALPFNRGVEPIEAHIIKSQRRPDKPKDVENRQKLLDAIKSTYLCTPYRGSSLDLIQAVARQFKFAFKATKIINWDVPQGIVNGIRNYSSFLAIIKENKNLTAVPTIEIDLAWHTHMLHHKSYRTFSVVRIGRLINHDDTIPEAELNEYVQETNVAWRKRNESRLSSNLAEESSNNNEEKRKSNLKGKLQSILGNKKFGKSNGYRTEVDMFKGAFSTGRYTSSPPYQPQLDKKVEGSEYSKTDNTVSTKIGELTQYDTEKISFHDRRDVKEFINLKNDDQLMDSEFARVKKSVYGFIGTSTCANTDILDQWVENTPHAVTSETITEPLDENTPPPYPGNNSIQSGDVSRYKKVYLTEGPLPEFTKKAASSKYLDSLRKAHTHKYSSFQEEQATRNRSAQDDFNWYLVSLTWYQATYATANNYTLGGWSSALGTNPGPSCAGMTSACTAKGGYSSCGGGLSSCAGTAFAGCTGVGMSSCGSGGSSGCGGGGGGGF